MITSFHIKDFGPIGDVTCNKIGKINLVIGPNGSGKTFLLKALYASLKTTELFKRGKEVRKDSEILFDKLHWTFQIDQLGELVRANARNAEISMAIQNKGCAKSEFAYSFGPATERLIKIRANTCHSAMIDSIFLPAKEVLSLLDTVIRSREEYKEFGFDETYYDLAKSLQIHTTKGRNLQSFSESRNLLKEKLGGSLVYDEKNKEWSFRQGNKKYPIATTSEGIKKMSILDTLLGNHYLKPGATIFIDEPEAALHPSLISSFMDIIGILCEANLQFFLSSHSYFVIKKLYLVAHKKNIDIPVVSLNDDGTMSHGNLREEMPDNPIIDESIRLYKEEIEL